MDTWIISALSTFRTPRAYTRVVEASDVVNAIQMSGIPSNEVVAVQLKAGIKIEGL